ncbi:MULTISPECIES: M64 family metallopeptidase [Sphingobacterium]|uniref:M64 family metallopeptidase n=1 Tax=Sphingobacterium TaxID=28453 RepID=UPI0013DA2213|nr:MULTISPECIES: M64 family metallopeptidase [unclassified Sphingobacterium]
MNRFSFLLIWAFSAVNFIFAQEKYQIDTLIHQGPDEKMVTFVILGDGYTKAEQDKFSKEAEIFVRFF